MRRPTGDVHGAKWSDRLPRGPSEHRTPRAARPDTPKDASERIQPPEILDECPPAPFLRWKFPQLSADRQPLHGIRRPAHREAPRPHEERRRPTKAYGCARADGASPIRAAAIFARYARPRPPARTRRTTNRLSSTPSCCNPSCRQSPLYNYCGRRSTSPRRSSGCETGPREPRYGLRRMLGALSTKGMGSRSRQASSDDLAFFGLKTLFPPSSEGISKSAHLVRGDRCMH